MYLDEVASLAPLPEDLVTGILTTGAGSGIRFVMVLQDKAFAKKVWGEDIGSAIDANVGAVLFLPGNSNVEVARTYSELMGQAYVKWASDDQDPNAQKQTGFQQILRPEDINRLKPGRAILVMRSQLPLEVEGIPFPERAWHKQMRASITDLLARPVSSKSAS
jgi:type IV secretory pathway TraG/TraD family ATPase VirD4